MSYNYQPIFVLSVKNANEYFISNKYGYSGYGMFQYIVMQFKSAKKAKTNLKIDYKFIHKMQINKDFNIVVFYNMLFVSDLLKLHDPGNMQDAIYKAMLLIEQKPIKFLSEKNFKKCVVKK